MFTESKYKKGGNAGLVPGPWSLVWTYGSKSKVGIKKETKSMFHSSVIN